MVVCLSVGARLARMCLQSRAGTQNNLFHLSSGDALDVSHGLASPSGDRLSPRLPQWKCSNARGFNNQHVGQTVSCSTPCLRHKVCDVQVSEARVSISKIGVRGMGCVFTGQDVWHTTLSGWERDVFDAAVPSPMLL